MRASQRASCSAEAAEARPAERFLIIGTAGHIDHGKTSLVKALTGIDTDRLPEEQRRGVTIELGFAHLEVGPYRFGVVDVPGHERFVRTMVAGATGIDLALLVVAADDSVMPQTVEHVEILDLLGVHRGVVAITKTDLAEEDLCKLVADDVAELLQGTSLAGAATVPVSSVTGAGLDRLREALAAAASELAERRTAGAFRLALDRVFSVTGRGTVGTGSVLQGQVAAGDELELWPAGLPCRVRALQSHNEVLELIHGGQRAALNLIGVDRERIERGCELATPGYLRATHVLDVRLRCLGSAQRPIRSRSNVRLCMGTRELLARVVTPGGDPIQPGEQGYAQLRLSEPVVATHGQRFIVRDEAATRTVGGGAVLRCSPQRRRIRGADGTVGLQALDQGDALQRVEEVIRFGGFSRSPELTIAAEAGVPPGDVAGLIAELARQQRIVAVEPGGKEEFAKSALETLGARALGWLKRYHETHPEEPGAPVDTFIGYLDRKSRRGLGRPLFDGLVSAVRVKVQGRYVCHPTSAPALSVQDEKLLTAIVGEFEAAALQPPALEELAAARQVNAQRIARLVKIAVATRQLIEVHGRMYLHPTWEQRLRERVGEILGRGGDASTSAIREGLGSTRKYVVPLLEYLDRIGFTRREGDQRVLCGTEKA